MVERRAQHGRDGERERGRNDEGRGPRLILLVSRVAFAQRTLGLLRDLPRGVDPGHFHTRFVIGKHAIGRHQCPPRANFVEGDVSLAKPFGKRVRRLLLPRRVEDEHPIRCPHNQTLVAMDGRRLLLGGLRFRRRFYDSHGNQVGRFHERCDYPTPQIDFEELGPGDHVHFPGGELPGVLVDIGVIVGAHDVAAGECHTARQYSAVHGEPVLGGRLIGPKAVAPDESHAEFALAVITDKVTAAMAGPVIEEVPELGRRLPVGEPTDRRAWKQGKHALAGPRS